MLAQLDQVGIWELRTRSSWLAVESVTRGVLSFVVMSGNVAGFKQEIGLLHFYDCPNLPFCSRYPSLGFFFACSKAASAAAT